MGINSKNVQYNRNITLHMGSEKFNLSTPNYNWQQRNNITGITDKSWAMPHKL
jgi:hypothetical protein